jgi:hypothetical protein
MADSLVHHCETKLNISSFYACDTIVTGVRGLEAIDETEAW